MAEDDHGRPGPGDLQTPFLFVPHGDPLPLDWMARHPGWVRFPATMVPRRPADCAASGTPSRQPPRTPPLALATPTTDAATLGMTGGAAAAIPGVLDAYEPAAAAAALAIPLAPELVLVLVVSAAGVLVWEYVTREQARSLQAHPAAPLATPMPPPLPADPGFVPPPRSARHACRRGPAARAARPRPARPAAAGRPGAPRAPNPRLRPGRTHNPPPKPQRGSGRRGKDALAARQERGEGDRPGGHAGVAGRGVGSPPSGERRGGVRQPRASRGGDAGWLADGPSNLVALPASPEAQKKLRESGIHRPLHDSSHPRWNRRADTEVRDIPRKLEKDGLSKGTSGYDQAAKKALEDIQDDLRREMLKLDRVTQNEEASSPHDAEG